jgi:hypothetical protein
LRLYTEKKKKRWLTSRSLQTEKQKNKSKDYYSETQSIEEEITENEPCMENFSEEQLDLLTDCRVERYKPGH